MSPIKSVPLGEVATLQAGVGFPTDLQGKRVGVYPMAKVGDISRNGRLGQTVLSSADHYVDRVDLERLRTKPVPRGSVLFAKIGEAISQNHRVIAGCDMLIDNNAMAVIPGPNIESPYLYHYLRTVDFYRLASATTVPALRKSELQRIDIPLPPLSEQRRIAAILDKADELRAKRRNGLSQISALAQTIFLEFFGDPATNPKAWPIYTIGDLLQSASYGTSAKADEEGAVPVLRMNNITSSGEIDLRALKFMDLDGREKERYMVRKGDVLFNRTNSAELVGKTAIFREVKPMAYAGYLIRLRSNDENHPEYLAAFLNTLYAKRVLRGMCKAIIGMANINATEIQSMRIPRPPMTLQSNFAQRIEAVEELKATQSASLSQMDALLSSLQYRAFRGEL